MAKSTTRTRRRSGGEGSVYEVAGGGWRGAITWTEPDGTRRRRLVRGATSDLARDALDQLRLELKRGTIAPPGRTLTTGAYLADWIERHRARVRPSTFRGIESHVRIYLVPSLGRIPLARLTAADVERAIAGWMRTGRPLTTSKRGRQVPAPVSPQTARHVRSTLRRAREDDRVAVDDDDFGLWHAPTVTDWSRVRRLASRRSRPRCRPRMPTAP